MRHQDSPFSMQNPEPKALFSGLEMPWAKGVHESRRLRHKDALEQCLNAESTDLGLVYNANYAMKSNVEDL